MEQIQSEDRIIGQMNNSLYFTIPAAFVEQMNLKKGEGISIRLEHGELIASPKKKSTTAEDIHEIDAMIDRYADAMKYLEDK